MWRPSKLNPICTVLPVALVALTGLLAAAPANAAGATKTVAKQVQNADLGKTVLATTKGRTLYSLSTETNGRFICKGSCLSIWRPLLVPDSVKPKGPVKLGTVERPDNRTQVTYKGRPLYAFSGDSKAGETNGEGIKDVGTWHVATIAKLPPQPQPEPQPAPPPPYPDPY
jgi:predicted lipoprotein with Yx(FWY)xxD motif